VAGSVQAQGKKPNPKDEEYYELMKTFADTFEQIERNYVKGVDRRVLLEAAIQGMVSKLDQYSSYIKPEDLARFNRQVEQQFGGVGIQVSVDPTTNTLTVMTPLPGTPAYKAGIRAGDRILEIEDKSTKGFSISDAVKLMKGKPGEPVTMGIKHAGSDKLERIKVVRAIIQVATVLGDTYGEDDQWDFMLKDEKDIAYLRLTHFSRRSAAELRDALESAKKHKLKGLVLDLRFNPGGLLSQARDISDMFIESGKIVSTKGRNTRERVWKAKKDGTYSGFPVAVLVNRYSASASEIVSACLQDHKRAVVIGERTWGKGSVQNVIQLEGGNSALKLTTASYHRPSGKNIHKFPGAKDSDEWGVMPDEGQLVQLTTEEMRNYLDYRRDRDVLKKGGPPKSDFKDRQLAKAIEFLKAKVKPAAKADGGDKKDKPKDAKKPQPEKTKAVDKTSAQRPITIRFLRVLAA
jgi:carboxyl-terminal processing protease